MEEEEDPFTTFLQAFFDCLLHPDVALWDPTKVALGGNDVGFLHLRSFLISELIADYNSRLLLKTANFELTKDPRQFPSVFVEQYHTNECLRWVWKKSVISKWPELRGVSPPFFPINEDVAQDLLGELEKRSSLNIQKIISKPKWRVAAFHLNPKKVLEKSVKFILRRGQGDSQLHSCLGFRRNKNYQVEVAMKPVTNGFPTEEESSADCTTLLAQCVLKLSRNSGYLTNSLLDNSEDKVDSRRHNKSRQYYLEIPESICMPEDHVLVSCKNVMATETNPSDQVVVELNAKDFYSQYAETVVILYNYARIKTILEKYEGLVGNGEYPPIPAIDKADFTLIGSSKEELPMVLMLFMWPLVRDTIINWRRRGRGCDKINLSFMFEFMKGLARSFDAFYNRNIIIVPQSAPHNFEAMFARLYLLESLYSIFKEFIYLSGVEID